MNENLIKVYRTRYFWLHLARAELKNKFRRSKLGILWTFMNPLLLTLLMSTVFGTVFNMSFTDYAPYVLSGLIVWELISSSFIGGGYSILTGEQYIRQFNHPIIIYTLRSALVFTTTFAIAMTSLIIWMLFMNPENVVVGLVTLPLTTVLYFFLSWAITTIAGFTNAKYRDYPQVMALVIQAVWYVSPVFFKKEMFTSNPALELFFSLNPITHILALVREPLLNGSMPTLNNYLFTVVTIVILAFVAAWINKNNQNKVIFYL
ncbi:ABC transporter permease [Paenibacillus radicis (ex Gao et al. 2016)]|uniref:Transport permease protein n=1 Tax=Paenibacillus radicis (ex Gao et al. 2016) TaxID=1737354 RepID=A0A917H0Y0_9BACL|nr:ABC transporter permease [Paenibacillus radicis (ex Gao et al. 2016)]GGG63322.1 transport permease protein [Paenibacillus radicis (ex Gao et al. 2016)]